MFGNLQNAPVRFRPPPPYFGIKETGWLHTPLTMLPLIWRGGNGSHANIVIEEAAACLRRLAIKGKRRTFTGFFDPKIWPPEA